MKMNKRYFSPLLAVAVFATATVAEAAVHRVYPTESIQDAIDIAAPGDTIWSSRGLHNPTRHCTYGLRITHPTSA